jgi:anti-sigma factor RsiW
MQRPSDELLVAYLDGELDDRRRAEVEAWLAHDASLRETVAQLRETDDLLRESLESALREPLPERLIEAARGPQPSAEIVAFRPAAKAARTPLLRRWWIGLPVAASLFGLMVGTGAGYFGLSKEVPQGAEPTQVAANGGSASANASWLDNVAGYYKLFVSAEAGGDQASFVDIPAKDQDRGELIKKISRQLPQEVKPPDLKPWGLTFQGARLLVIEGRPAAQLFYTGNKAIGPLTVVIGSSKRQDMTPTFDRREDVNVLYWRHQGRAYAIVGQADIGYLWNLANDIAWQLDAI